MIASSKLNERWQISECRDAETARESQLWRKKLLQLRKKLKRRPLQEDQHKNEEFQEEDETASSIWFLYIDCYICNFLLFLHFLILDFQEEFCKYLLLVFKKVCSELNLKCYFANVLVIKMCHICIINYCYFIHK